MAKAAPITTERSVLEGVRTPLRDKDGRRYYRGKIMLADETHARIKIPDDKRYDERAARNYLAFMQEAEDETHALFNAKQAEKAKRDGARAGAHGELCDVWYERFYELRVKERPNSKGPAEDRRTWRRVAKSIRDKAIRLVTPDDIEDIRDRLNALVDAYEAAGCMSGPGRLSYSSAATAWGVITSAFKYAATRKGPRELRVREDLGNPCAGIEPPRRGGRKERRWLRPYEVDAVIAWLVAHGEREWAEAIAIGYYLHLRPNELHELRAKDVDLVAHEVSITRAYDERTGTVGPPKSEAGVRTSTIAPTLLPLLTRLVRERSRDELLCPIIAATPESHRSSGVSRATLIRDFVEKAGVDRALELFEETRTHKPLDFRGAIRDSGITARFLADHKAEDVQREAGLENIATTLGYAKEVKNRQGRYGTPFAPLPPRLIDPSASIVASSSSLVESVSRAEPQVQIPVHATPNQARSLLQLLDSNQRPGG